MTARVLLTGITGYVGQHCAAELLTQGYQVVGTIRSRSKADAARAGFWDFPARGCVTGGSDATYGDGIVEPVRSSGALPMRAIVYTRYGAPEVLTLTERDKPVPRFN